MSIGYARLFGVTPDEMRRMCLRCYVEPLARMVFRRIPAAQSLVFALAQYWNDEADDAVHQTVVLCDHRDPKWPDCLSYANNKLIPIELPYDFDQLDPEEQEWAREEATERAKNIDNFGRYSAEEGPAGEAVRIGQRTLGVQSFLDDNNTLSRAFAPFCKKGASQDMSVSESYLPYAVVRREEQGISTQIVAEPELYPSAIDEALRSTPELSLPTQGELAVRLALLQQHQALRHRLASILELVSAARTLDASDEETADNQPRMSAPLVRAIAAARKVGES